MYARRVARQSSRLALAMFIVVGAASVAAQEHQHGGRVEGQKPPAEGQHEQHAAAGDDQQIPMTRDGSGTSWLPDESPMYALHTQVGTWMVMGHGNVFLQRLDEGGTRGLEQTGSINWLMGMGQRRLGAGQLTLRGMVSFEPWTTGDCGYPNLLATGEFCEGEALHDRQHPHDLFMELAAQYNHPLGKGLHLEVYGGPVGEPALGPVAFMHRASGLANPLAPVTHHWFDSTHITYGVLTGGVYAKRWKVEASVFNGREPDEDRTDFDFAAMDSWSARAWFLPNAHWALQFSGGRLNEVEPGHDLEPPTDIDRLTASATYHRAVAERSIWATTVGWGRNAERGGVATNSLLLESSVTLHERDAWYGRFEWAEKSAHDLVVAGEGVFDVAKLQGGYTRYFAPWNGLTPGIGGLISGGIVPASLEPVYGGRFNTGVGVYLTLRPAAHQQ